MNDVVIIGAGIAGASAAWHLRQAGRSCLVIDDGGGGASANSAGAVHPALHLEDTPMRAFYAAAYPYALALLATLPQGCFDRCGMLILPKNPGDDRRFARLAEVGLYRDWLAPPPAEVAGLPVETGIFLAGSGVVYPPRLCAALLAGSMRMQARVVAVNPGGVSTDTGQVVRARQIVVAAGYQTVALCPAAAIQPTRGQITHLRADQHSQALQTVVSRKGYILPAGTGGVHVAGATYQRGRADTVPLAADDACNVAQTGDTLPGFPVLPVVGRQAAVRAVTRNHVPLIAEMATGVYALTGLGSRGLCGGLYAGKLLAERMA